MEIPIIIPPCRLLKTAQTAVFQAGDNGTYQTGYALSNRFRSLGNGAVRDLLTNLDWVADPSQLGGAWGVPGTPAKMTWSNGITECEALSYGGYSDWRMPNIRELISLITFYSLGSAAILNINGFNNIQADIYFSSTTRASATTFAWYANFSTTASILTVAKTTPYYILPVRGGI